MPTEFLYATVATPFDLRVYLFDLTGEADPVEVVHVEASSVGPAPTFVSALPSSAITPDGSLITFDFGSFTGVRRIYTVRPATGDLALIAEERRAYSPVVAPDGSAVAYTWSTDESRGVWVRRTGESLPTLLVYADPSWFVEPRPLGWVSPIHLAVNGPNAHPGGPSAVGVIDVRSAPVRFDPDNPNFSGAVTILGETKAIDASRGEGDLLLWTTQTAVGGRTEITAFDLPHGQRRTLYAPAFVSLHSARWHPSGASIVTVENHELSGLEVWLRRGDGTATRQLQANGIADAWWSRDGRTLFARISSMNGLWVEDLTNHRTVATLCAQGTGRACPARAP